MCYTAAKSGQIWKRKYDSIADEKLRLLKFIFFLYQTFIWEHKIIGCHAYICIMPNAECNYTYKYSST